MESQKNYQIKKLEKTFKKNKKIEDRINAIIGRDSETILTLEEIVKEINDPHNSFTKTAFYLIPYLYSIDSNCPAEKFSIDATIEFCLRSITYLNGIVETMRALRNEVKSKKIEMGYADYLSWLETDDGLAYGKIIRNRIGSTVQNKHYKDQILCFLKSYNLNKATFNSKSL